MEHLVRCPHCTHIAVTGTTQPNPEAVCGACGKTYYDLGPLPFPNWEIRLTGTKQPAKLTPDQAPVLVCGYCCAAVSAEDHACPRCATLLSGCGLPALRAGLAAADTAEVGAYTALSRPDVTLLEALLRLHRLPSYTVRSIGGDIQLANTMYPIEQPPKAPEPPPAAVTEIPEEAEGGSLFARGVAAALLFVGFYLMAFAMVAAILGLMYLDLSFGYIHIKAWIVGFIFIGLILWAIMPRWDRFEPPGPEIKEADQPRLFAMIREVAKATGARMPHHVYLVPQVNAYVQYRGGIMGLGSKRVMGLGLPLMQGLTVSEMKAVLAHEFGHYQGGDVALGPWIYKTREAIGRTVETFSDEQGQVDSIGLIFDKYGRFFLKTTQKISRRQEYNADALAARTMGSNVLAASLAKSNGLAAAFDRFWDHEALPVLHARMRPRLADGFRRFTQSSDIARMMAEQTENSAADTDAHPFASHPPTALRIAAARRFPEKPVAADEPLASSVLVREDAVEMTVLHSMLMPAATAFPILDWDRLADEVYLPQWRAKWKEQRAVAADVALADFPDMAGDIHGLAARSGMDEAEHTRDERADHTRYMLHIAAGLAFVAAGWHLVTAPGDALDLLGPDGRRFNALQVLEDLRTGDMTTDTWYAHLAAAGLRDHVLGRPVRRAPAQEA